MHPKWVFNGYLERFGLFFLTTRVDLLLYVKVRRGERNRIVEVETILTIGSKCIRFWCSSFLSKIFCKISYKTQAYMNTFERAFRFRRFHCSDVKFFSFLFVPGIPKVIT